MNILENNIWTHKLLMTHSNDLGKLPNGEHPLYSVTLESRHTNVYKMETIILTNNKVPSFKFTIIYLGCASRIEGNNFVTGIHKMSSQL